MKLILKYKNGESTIPNVKDAVIYPDGDSCFYGPKVFVSVRYNPQGRLYHYHQVHTKPDSIKIIQE